jgi:dual specificity MAP kinase phosphatase
MATITISRPVAPHRAASGIDGLTSSLGLDALDAIAAKASPRPRPVPNKHLPACPPGPMRLDPQPNTPPPSPGAVDVYDTEIDLDGLQPSLLFPPHRYVRLQSGPLSLYKIDALQVAEALHHIARQPLPDPSHVFPWLHGLHPNNHIQLAFFASRRRALRKTPCSLRGLTLVKADGNLASSRLKGAIAPEEFLQPGSDRCRFLEIDPKDGFSVRNFQIQAAKSAMTSDIIVYGEDEVAVRKLGWDIAAAQQHWRDLHEDQDHALPEYNTFVCVSPFSQFEERHAEIVAVDSSGHLTGNVLDFAFRERAEMYAMSKASEISHNVWLGPTPEASSGEEDSYDILIECSDGAKPNPDALQAIAETGAQTISQPWHDFPSSGSLLPPSWSHAEADEILETCRWIYHLAHGSTIVIKKRQNVLVDVDGDTGMTTQPHEREKEQEEEEQADFRRDNEVQVRPCRILIHCADGYTESTMLAIAYSCYSTGRPIPEAWLRLHTDMGRNFFAYPSDVALLTAIGARLVAESPVHVGKPQADVTSLANQEPRWFAGLDGSFPSRILDYMYLGNLGHANNPDLLRALGITQILSVGETPMWREGELEEWGEEHTCVVKGVQDNGIDPLTEEFDRCMDFLGKLFRARSKDAENTKKEIAW